MTEASQSCSPSILEDSKKMFLEGNKKKESNVKRL